MHEQAENENDRPFALKRERRQSKTFQGLLQKEPVTRSPFKQRVPSMEDVAPPLPPAPTHLSSRLSIPSPLPAPTPATTPATSIDPPPSAPTTGPSPARSSLVSRRMHGPRLSGGGGKRGRRKTVTFDERCDVVEFDREETDEESDNDEYGDDGYGFDQEHERPIEEDLFFNGGTEGHRDDPMHEREENTSYESIDLSDIGANGNNSPSLRGMGLDPDTSISGLVDEMLFSSNAASINTPDPTLSRKPSHPISNNRDDTPPHQVTDNGVDDIFGGLLHSDQFFRHQHRPHLPSPPTSASPHHWTPPQQSSAHQLYLPESLEPSHATSAAPQVPSPTPPPPRRKQVPTDIALPGIAEGTGSAAVNTPPNHRSSPRFDVGSESFTTPPFARSSHLDRARGARQENGHVGVETLLETPPRNLGSAADAERPEGLLPIYEHQSEIRGSLCFFLCDFLDEIYHTDCADELITAQGQTSKEDDDFNFFNPKDGSPRGGPTSDPIDPSNLSVVSSEVGLSSLGFEGDDKMKVSVSLCSSNKLTIMT